REDRRHVRHPRGDRAPADDAGGLVVVDRVASRRLPGPVAGRLRTAPRRPSSPGARMRTPAAAILLALAAACGPGESGPPPAAPAAASNVPASEHLRRAHEFLAG